MQLKLPKLDNKKGRTLNSLLEQHPTRKSLIIRWDFFFNLFLMGSSAALHSNLVFNRSQTHKQKMPTEFYSD